MRDYLISWWSVATSFSFSLRATCKVCTLCLREEMNTSVFPPLTTLTASLDCMCACACVCVHVHVYVCMCVCVCMYVYVRMCACVHVCMCVYVHVDTCAIKRHIYKVQGVCV